MVKVFNPIANDLVPENIRSLITDRNAAKAEKNFSLADKLRNPEYIKQIKQSDILFMGPGSPTYGIRQLRGTKALEAIIEQVKNRATLILASAATITFSTHALPVYEIYKVGEDLHWVDGLNLYSKIYEPLTVIPHFNNREGGVGLDTSYCYIGKDRATKLLSSLPGESKVIGIDEHASVIIDLDTKELSVRGKGELQNATIVV